MAPGSINRFQIAAVVLAGGEGRRMGGADKGLVELAGRPMVAWALERLAPQAAQLLVNANRSLEAYRQLTGEVVTDAAARDGEGFAGPLAGFLAGMRATSASWLLTLPCDAPFAPTDLASRLAASLCREHTRIAVAEAGGRLHPVHAMIDTGLADDLDAFLASGQRKVMRWIEQQPFSIVNFDDQPEAFINVNTPEELDTQSQRIRKQQSS